MMFNEFYDRGQEWLDGKVKAIQKQRLEVQKQAELGELEASQLKTEVVDIKKGENL